MKRCDEMVKLTDAAERDAFKSALTSLLVACNQANMFAIQKLGGVVIDFDVISNAQRILTGGVSFCGGWPNILRSSDPLQAELDWDTKNEN